MSAVVLNRLLRAPDEIAAACREDRDIRAIAATSLAALVVGSAVFGGVIGSFRGGLQIVYAAIKVPLAMTATLALCVPAFHAIAAGLGRAFPIRTIVALALAAAGRAALVLLALAPVLWLCFDRGLGYHGATLASAVAYAAGGAAAFSVMLRGLGGGQGRLVTALAFAALFFAVGGQTSWILRPYLIRPRTWAAASQHVQKIPFLRAYEGSFVDSIYQSSRSARDVYDAPAGRWDAAPESEQATPVTRVRRKDESQ
ncbi:Hypothetical protein A7982_08850 [Minicystis rosea]|nr:Hypothetical protein A7982_08850 [Minicystis rosea]